MGKNLDVDRDGLNELYELCATTGFNDLDALCSWV